MTEIVYLGKRLIRGGKLAMAVVPLSELPQEFEGLTGHIYLFDPKGTNFQTIGGIYEVEGGVFTEDGRLSKMNVRGVYKDKLRTVGYLPELEAADRAARLKVRADKEHDKAARDQALEKLLDRLATIYELTTPNSRQAFLLMVMERLMRGKTYK